MHFHYPHDLDKLRSSGLNMQLDWLGDISISYIHLAAILYFVRHFLASVG